MKRKSELELYFNRTCPTEGDDDEEDEEEEEEEEKVEEKKLQQEMEPFKLSPSQQKVLTAVQQNCNVFFTGSAGSGKSRLLKEIEQVLKKKRLHVEITASTGAASFSIGKGTLHAFAGIGIGEGSWKDCLDRLNKRPHKVKLWKSVDVLIIDEISMVSTEFLEKLNQIAKSIRNNYSPFGGIQLIFVGDYFQLPAVLVEGSHTYKFPFLAPIWRELRFQCIALKENFRQAGDTNFFQLLERIKLCTTTESDLILLKSRLIENFRDTVDCDDLIKLCPKRAKAEEINLKEIGQLSTQSHFFKAVIVDYDDQGQIKKANNTQTKQPTTAENEKKYPVDINLELKVGVEVLLCCNIDVEKGLFNGARGRVVDFSIRPGTAENSEKFPLVKFKNGHILQALPYEWETQTNGKRVKIFTQIPLIPRYAITVHKAQGLTLDKVLVYGDFFLDGQAYVALSRVRSLDDLYLDSVDLTRYTTSEDVIRFYRKNNLLLSPVLSNLK